MKEKKRLTAKEVAQLLGTPMVTVLRWAHQGKIPCKLKKDTYFFKKNEIMDWANAHDLLVKKEEDKKSKIRQEESVSLKKAVEQGGFIHNLEGSDIYSVLKHAVDKIKLPEDADRELVLDELLNREEIASTGIGKGVAIPHPRTTLNLNLQNPVIPVVFLEQPVDFNAVDGEEIFVLFLMFSPSTQIHLKLLSRLSICLRNKEFLSLLNKRASEIEILAKIEQIEKELGHGES
ncbi:MAG: PTS sugar transporter subunit IIA [Candidatus Aminicenantes bacterium]|nr:MAG: PTS sugar transporter subunit IIA [Candidatus Aminicenantes bacterium]